MSGPVRPPLTVETVDGATVGRPITTLKVSNGTLTISGSTATVTTGGGGGGSGTVTSVNPKADSGTGTAITTTGSFELVGGTGITTSINASNQITIDGNTGTVTSVLGSSPVSSTGGTTPTISMSAADSTTDGYLTSTDWNTFNTKGSGTVTGTGAASQVAVWSGTTAVAGSNGLLFDGTSLTVNTLSASDPVINISSNTKSVSLEVNTNQELSIKGSADKFTFDASSDTGGITWPDGTTQITANNTTGTITSVSGTAPIVSSGGTTPAISLANTAVTAGAYTNTDLTVDAQGRITAASSGSSGGSGTVTSITASSPLTGGAITTTGTIGIPASTAAVDGYLSSTDFTIFNDKQDALSLTTTGSSGAATLVGSTLNIPQYSGGGGGGIGGSGTIGTIPVFVTNTTTLGDSRLIQSGTTDMIYSASSGAAFSVKSNDTNEPNFKLLTSTSQGLRFELTDADTITMKKVGTNTLRYRSDGTAFTIFNNTSSTDGIFSATYSTGAIKINNAYTLPTAVTGANDYVLTAQTDGSTAWAAAAGGSTSPAGSDTEVQFNNSGSFGASSNLTFDGTYLSPNLVKLADGSNTGSFPYALGFASDDDTGLYRSAANQLAFSTGGSQVLTFGGFPKRVLLGEHTGTTATSLSTYGAQDIVISTNQTTNSGTITITDGVDGDISLTPNGSGAVEISGVYKLPTAVTAANDYILTAQTDGSTAWAAAPAASVTFPLEGSDGSAGAPTYSFSSASNLGFYKDGSTAVSFTSGGTRQMSFDAGGVIRLGGTSSKVSTYNANNLVLDTDVGVNSGSITINSGVNGNIDLLPDGTGKVKLGTLPFKADQVVGAGQDNFVLTYDNSSDSISLEAAGGGGGGGSVSPVKPPAGNAGGTSDPSWANTEMPFGNARTTTQTINTNQPVYLPFIARRTDTLDKGYLYVSSAAGSTTPVKIGLYSDSSGLPGTLRGVASVDAASTGALNGSFAAEPGQDLDTTAGEQYWLAVVRGSANDFTVGASDISYSGSMAWRNSYNASYGVVSQTGSDNALPATASITTGFAYQLLAVGVGY